MSDGKLRLSQIEIERLVVALDTHIASLRRAVNVERDDDLLKLRKMRLSDFEHLRNRVVSKEFSF